MLIVFSSLSLWSATEPPPAVSLALGEISLPCSPNKAVSGRASIDCSSSTIVGDEDGLNLIPDSDDALANALALSLSSALLGLGNGVASLNGLLIDPSSVSGDVSLN